MMKKNLARQISLRAQRMHCTSGKVFILKKSQGPLIMNIFSICKTLPYMYIQEQLPEIKFEIKVC